MSRSEPLNSDKLRQALSQNLIGRQVIVLASTGSSNDFLLRMLNPQLREGFVVFAEEQTAARGQRGNRWAAAAGLGLWFSFLLRPDIPLAESARLTTWAAQAIAATIQEELGLEAGIKPPNDIYLGNRKVAGVLVETKVRRGTAFDAVVGIGVNLHHEREDFPPELRERAGSLAMFHSGKIDRTNFAIALLRELDRTNRFRRSGTEATTQF
jgi:BirA family biotin operon repressor/biotin-[acetyl-CoA-carboxylase] ligase